MMKIHQLESVPFTTKADRVNEVPDKEVEIKHKLSNKVDPDVLAQAIFDKFHESRDGHFRIAESLPTIAEVKTRQLKYVDSTKDELLFTVVIRERDGAIFVKQKGSKAEGEEVELRDEIKTQLSQKAWTPELEERVIALQAKDLGVSAEAITLRSDLSKRKLKVRIENIKTHRIYTVGVITKKAPDKKAKTLLSIEYVGREVPKNSAREEAAKYAIMDDIKTIDSTVLSLGPEIQV